MTVQITAQQRANLEVLADYLASRCPPEQFTMQVYCSLSRDPVDVEHPPHLIPECGTVGCAVGQGPAAGIPVPEDCTDWVQYRIRMFGSGLDLQLGLFHHEWTWVDNTPAGAAERIRRFLDTGELRHPDGSVLEPGAADARIAARVAELQTLEWA